jgi:transcriptional regulator with XRE-family HTH domain
MGQFGQQLRRLRLRAGLGLRTFAELVDERTSTVSAIELGARTPWHRLEKLHRVADVLGLIENSDFCQEFVVVAHNEPANGAVPHGTRGQLAWWWTTDHAPPLEESAARELAEFIGADTDGQHEANGSLHYPPLTELAAEWRVRKLLGRRDLPISAAPVDVEAVLESQAGVRIEIVAGLVPRYSVQACALMAGGSLTFLVDRIVADSRPLVAQRSRIAVVRLVF